MILILLTAMAYGGHGGGGHSGGGHHATSVAPHYSGTSGGRGGGGNSSFSRNQSAPVSQPVMFPDRLPEARLARWVHHIFHPHEASG
jgi:hypothetical protein